MAYTTRDRPFDSSTLRQAQDRPFGGAQDKQAQDRREDGMGSTEKGERQMAENEEKKAQTWGMLCHLTALLVFIGIPFGNLI
ncbi:MAG: hypothetical protein JRF69_12280, partial [Deltaproteobacteria bacterium]|nr:hypothetical protein [Deltaproteobacteria bacterium]